MSKVILILLVAVSSIYGQSREKDIELEWILKTLRLLISGEEMPAQEMLDDVSRRLLREFDEFLERPEEYREKVLHECAVFPEGRIYPFTMPALAYANLAIKHPHTQSHCLKQMAGLIDLEIPMVVQYVSPPGGDLVNLVDYQGQGTYLSTLNLTLGVYAVIGGDERYEKTHERVSAVLYKAVKDRDGLPIESYPGYTYNFDTIMALLSLHLYDRLKGTTGTKDLLQRYLQWRHKDATHAPTGLPYSISWNGDGILPRGCDLSLQICLLAQMDKGAADALYQKYVASHWIDRGFAAGFAEWPKNTAHSAGDIDSGPIFFDIGLTATGLGIGTTLAMNDRDRLQRLCSQLGIVGPTLETLMLLNPNNGLLHWFAGRVDMDRKYFTGFLYGDAALFYSITWMPYPDGKSEPSSN